MYVFRSAVNNSQDEAQFDTTHFAHCKFCQYDDEADDDSSLVWECMEIEYSPCSCPKDKWLKISENHEFNVSIAYLAEW